MSETRDDQVHELVHRLGTLAPPPPPFPDETAAAPPPRRPHVLALAAAAVLVVALIGGAWYAVHDDGDGAQLAVGDDEAAGDPAVVDDVTARHVRGHNRRVARRRAGGRRTLRAARPGRATASTSRTSATRALYVKLHDETLVAPNVIRWAWSPTEPVLAVVHDPGEGPGLHLFRVEDDQVVNIRSINGATDFAWSHGGNQLAFVQPDGLYRPGRVRQRASDE